MAVQLRLEFQQNQVADEVAAITAVVRPVLLALLHSLKREVVQEAGGYENVKLKMLSRLYRPGDGDCGLCFEYAVHDAMNRSEATVLERLVSALQRCRIRGKQTASILFGAEKSGGLRLIDTARDRLTDDSRILVGLRGQPPKLKQHLKTALEAMRKQEARELLPWSIRGIWKADLFVGCTDTDQWVATTVKINPAALEAAPGLRIGVVPNREGTRDTIRRDDARNLIICPIPHDYAFMQVFYEGWVVARQFLHADAQMPAEAFLPRPPERQVARYLEDRRDYPVVDVVAALGPLAQPELLHSAQREGLVTDAPVPGTEIGGAGETGVLEAPIPRITE
jgi:hypothetical protein